MLCRSKNSPNSVSLLTMPFALNCMMVKVFPSTYCVGIYGGSGCAVGRVDGERQELHVQSFIRRYSVLKTITNVPSQNNDCCCCMPFSTFLVVIPGSPGLESSVLVSS